MIENFVPFGWPVILYLTFTGMACGACLSALFFTRKNYKKTLVRKSLLLAVLSLSVGGCFLLTDLDAVGNLYHVFTAFNTSSAIAWGSRIICIFALLLIYILLFYKSTEKISSIPLILLFLAALFIGVYPALVLMQSTGRPLWDTFLLIPLFLLLGSHSGFSLVQLFSAAEWTGEQRAVKILDFTFIVLQIILVAGILFTSAVNWQSLSPVLSDSSLLTWGGVILAAWLMPILLSLKPADKKIVRIRQLSFIGGALALRAVIVICGQDPRTFIGVL